MSVSPLGTPQHKPVKDTNGDGIGNAAYMAMFGSFSFAMLTMFQAISCNTVL